MNMLDCSLETILNKGNVVKKFKRAKVILAETFHPINQSYIESYQ